MSGEFCLEAGGRAVSVVGGQVTSSEGLGELWSILIATDHFFFMYPLPPRKQENMSKKHWVGTQAKHPNGK